MPQGQLTGKQGAADTAVAERAREPGRPAPKRPLAAAGNRALQNLLTHRVSRPDDPHERQAERLAGRTDERDLLAGTGARVHSGARAAGIASAAGARAVTIGRDVFVAAGQFAPTTTAGRRLLAHELVHVAQQQHPGRTLAGERLEHAEPGLAHRNGPVGPVHPPEDPAVTAFKGLVLSTAKQRLRMNREMLSLWSGFLVNNLTPTEFQAQAFATIEENLFQTSRGTGAQHVYEQRAITRNPAMRYVQEQQIHGRWRGCTGCHATVQADNWAKTQMGTGIEWLTPLERMTGLAGEVGVPYTPDVASMYQLTPGEMAVAPHTMAMLKAVQRIEPYLQQLGPSGYKVIPEDVLSRLSGLSALELLAVVQGRIVNRQRGFDDLVREIDAGEHDYLLFIPIVDALLQTAAPDVRAKVEQEIERTKARQRAESYAVGGVGLLAFILTIFPPTAPIGIGLTIGTSLYGIGKGIEQFSQGKAISQGTGAGVFSTEQERRAEEMMASGLLSAVMSAIDLTRSGSALLKTAGGGGQSTALATREGGGIAPGRTLQQGPITVTASPDGSLFATHVAHPGRFIVIQNGVAKGYVFRNGTFELVGVRAVGPTAAGATTATGPPAGGALVLSPTAPGTTGVPALPIATPMRALPPGPAGPAALPGGPAPMRALPPGPVPKGLLTAPDLVWVNTRSGIYHRPGSAFYGTTQQGSFMTESMARQAGYREARGGGSLEAARRGTAEHAMIAKAQRPFEGTTTEGGWTLAAVERRVGGTKRVDELWINHQQKRIMVMDTYTGPNEPLPHYLKGWAYAREPDIAALIQQGYTYGYQVGIKHPSKLH